MTRLPWEHLRSRTKSGSEKTSLSHPQDWFSRSTAEPSRKAVTDLVKAHNRVKSDDSSSGKSRSRPRTNTATSIGSHGRGSRSGLSDEEALSRPSSQCASLHGTTPLSGRSEGSNSVLRSRSNTLLRRTSSILSLSSATSSSTLGLTSPPRSLRASSAASRSDDLRAKISPPFDFQHVSHTEDAQFAGLGRIDESTLADQFVAITADQPNDTSLRGIIATDIQASKADEQRQSIVHAQTVQDLTGSLTTGLPQSPPRPLPPPKDENFLDRNMSTRPANGIVPVLQEHAFESAGLMWLAAQSGQNNDNHEVKSNADMANLEQKPLPELPIVHAITTEDNIAREMITGPLPSPPVPSLPEVSTTQQTELHQGQPHVSLRLQNLYPTTKSSMPNLLAANQSLAVPRTLTRHHSDMALSHQARSVSTTASTRTSTSFAAVDIMNWEEVVDEAWDNVDGGDVQDHGKEIHIGSLNIESTSSTPLTMSMAFGAPPKSPSRVASTHNLEVHQLESVREDETIVDLDGLGISSCPPSGTATNVSRPSRSSSINFSKRRSSSVSHTEGGLTRSSSQDSFMMSITSSIGGTQRSSSSSVSAMDVANRYSNHTEECTEREYDEHSEKVVGTARPESGCLPLDILVQISQFGANSPGVNVDQTPLASLPPQQDHNESTANVIVPQRRSSILATNCSSNLDKRSSTRPNRPRQSAQVYSLFPSTQTISTHPSMTVTF